VRVLVVQNEPDDPPGRLGDWLADAGVIVEVREGADLPASLDGYSGLIVLGGSMNAYEDDVAPWFPHLRALLREAVADEVPTLGVCAGAQVLAVALGGRVERNEDGPEIGAYLIAKRASAATDPLFGPLPITPDVIQWHYDAITALPRGSMQLASSPMCANQAFRLGRLAWGVQFHIETTPDIVRGWADADAEQLEDYDLDLIMRQVEAIDDDIVEVWQPFTKRFAEVVLDPSSVRAARGVPTTTAEPITDPAAIRAAIAAEAQAAHSSRTSLPMPEWQPPDRG
jgi:GMP synthase-like glutamine amidotransferase